jgi:hypothetical protein
MRTRRESAALHAASLLALVTAVCFATGALGVPDRHTWQSMLSSREAGTDDFWLAAALRARTVGSPVLLPPEHIVVRWQTFAQADEVLLRGAGAEETVLHIAGLPATAVAGGMPASAGSGRWRCGDGPAACRIANRMVVSNLMLSAGSLPEQNRGAR